MKDGTLLFPVVPHKDRALPNHLEVGSFYLEFVLSSILGHFLRADEELGRSREVVDIFESKVLNFSHVIFQVQDDGEYPLGINEPPDSIEFCIIIIFLGDCTMCRDRSRD